MPPRFEGELRTGATAITGVVVAKRLWVGQAPPGPQQLRWIRQASLDAPRVHRYFIVVNIDAIRPQVRLVLKKLRALQLDHERGLKYVSFKPRDQFPVPELVLLVLRDVLNLEAGGPWEKTRWGVSFEYGGAYFAVELRKLGFTVIAQTEHPEGSPLTREMLGKLAKAVRIVERHLSGFVESQAHNGAVTIQNRFPHFNAAYQFFREQAASAYASKPPSPVVQRRGGDRASTVTHYNPLKPQREGGYLASAMMNSYFSRTEHFMVLALAFTRAPSNAGKLVNLIRSKWSDKVRALFDLVRDNVAKQLHDRMIRVRESLRNPLSHGGFEQGLGSLFFHLPRIGALPARMTRQKDGFHYVFVPIETRSFQEICQLFDEFDAFLAARLKFAWRWAASGLDVAYDVTSRAEYVGAMSSDAAFEQLIRDTARDVDHHAYFEY